MATTGTEAYAQDTPLPQAFGDTARIKIIAAMLSEQDQDINVTEIARLAGVARSTVYDHLDDLEEFNLIVQTRDVGGNPMYEINTDSPIVERVEEIEGLLLRQIVDE